MSLRRTPGRKEKKLTEEEKGKKKSRRLEEAQASTGKHKKGVLVMVADPPAEQGQSVSHSITHSLTASVVLSTSSTSRHARRRVSFSWGREEK